MQQNGAGYLRGGGGGGLAVAGGNGEIVNTSFVENRISDRDRNARGSGILVTGGEVSLYSTVVARGDARHPGVG